MLWLTSTILWVLIFLALFGINTLTGGSVIAFIGILSRLLYMPAFCLNLLVCFGGYGLIAGMLRFFYGLPEKAFTDEESFWYPLIPYFRLVEDGWPVAFLAFGLIACLLSLAMAILGRTDLPFVALSVLTLVGMTGNFFWWRKWLVRLHETGEASADKQVQAKGTLR